MSDLPIRNVSVEEVAAAVAVLPEAVRAELARGPHRYGCRLCRALRVGGWDCDDVEGDPNLLPGEALTLWQWHENHSVIVTRGLMDQFVEGDPTADQVRTTSRALEAVLGTPNASAHDSAYAFSGAVSYYKLLVVYLLAGWRPDAGPSERIAENFRTSAGDGAIGNSSVV